MRQSERVKEASRRALDRLSRMSKEELDQRLATRELGPVGRLLLESGTIRGMLAERTETSIFVTVEVIAEISGRHSTADNDVRYALAANEPWIAIKKQGRDLVLSEKSGPGIEQWAA